MQIAFDFVHSHLVVVIGRVRAQVSIQERICVSLVDGTREYEPQLGAKLVWQAFEYELVELCRAVHGRAAAVLREMAQPLGLLKGLAYPFLVGIFERELNE